MSVELVGSIVIFLLGAVATIFWRLWDGHNNRITQLEGTASVRGQLQAQHSTKLDHLEQQVGAVHEVSLRLARVEAKLDTLITMESSHE